jgi:starch phosphorylase
LIKTPPVVYFCAEFAIEENLPIYAGGLGVLAGDVLGQAQEDGRPYIGIGLFYKDGYLRQEISKEANVITTEKLNPAACGLQLLTENGKPVVITVPIHARTVQVRAWVKIVGSVPLLLLDTDVEGNEAQDIKLSDQLYSGDREHRFKQEMILGIGGIRLFFKLGIKERLFHLNEGHSALLLYELARQRLTKDSSKGIQEVLENLGNVVFTNHTLIPAGNDVFSKDLVISYLASFALEFPVDPAILVKFGLIQDTSLFSPTMLALRLSSVNQAVSKLHAAKALEVWSDHPMVAVTNGVRQKYWQAKEITQASSAEQSANGAALWSAHQMQKKNLLEYIKTLTGFAWEEHALVIAWARRLANYKRPLMLFEQEERLHKLLESTDKPVRIVISGKPHAHDEAAQENLRKILELVGKYDGKIVYIQNYGIPVAKLIMSGADVLLNTPVRGFEACGTSGMKASMNGVLQCTTLDGWTDEVNWDGIGWAIEDNNPAESLYGLLESQVIPLFWKRDPQNLPADWIVRMQKTIAAVIPAYTAKRMMVELEEKVYAQIKVS